MELIAIVRVRRAGDRFVSGCALRRESAKQVDGRNARGAVVGMKAGIEVTQIADEGVE